MQRIHICHPLGELRSAGRVVKYFKYKYFKYVFEIHAMYFVFEVNSKCILYLNTK